jgi:hypothetical protein
MTPHPELELARVAMIDTLTKTCAHAIQRGHVMDADDLQERGEHLQTVLNAVTTYVGAVIDDTAGHSVHFNKDSAGQAVRALRDVSIYTHDAIGDLVGTIFNAAEDAAEDRD